MNRFMGATQESLMKNPSILDGALREVFSEVKFDEPLASHTTLDVGGPARRFVIANNSDQLGEGVKICEQQRIPYFILGGGSNLIVSDSGFSGVVIKNRAQGWKIISDRLSEKAGTETSPPLRLQSPEGKRGVARLTPVGDNYYQADDLEYSEEDGPTVVVQVESGAKIDPLIKSLLQSGITGVQWFSGIPATVGGAIYMNMHGGYHFFGELVVKAKLAGSGALKEVNHDYFQFDYDRSILHDTKETVLWAQLRLFRGDVERAKATAREWARRKALQPQKSAGCIFRNLTAEEQRALHLPTPSIGYLVGHLLKLKGERRGDAIISPRHAAFIENLGAARAAEVKALVDLMAQRAKTELGIVLKPEIEFVGDF